MNRTDRFVMSHRPYAVDLSSWRRGEWKTSMDGRQYARHTIASIWFRRKRGVTVAHLGTISTNSGTDSAEDFLRLHNDSRYGGNWIAAWDGERCWTETPAAKTDLDRYAEVLGAALTGFRNDKAVPQGHCGWWTFHD